ncbi:alginate biosynthesis protein AlgX [Alcanivorax nanhaiticus]|uniref:Alginate biosynthesis protein AlgX n=1 Tax=Alcanivorax nanhaiticus TaxID=1177154 RepID=A0A095UM98_9GAMM|nr:alginate biosynthesis protein AlgX [Alcanivorax nanhaiticus]KGD63615.1 alginate biosynthesis protein AlgX [Alcanivorax nanhaiticus]
MWQRRLDMIRSVAACLLLAVGSVAFAAGLTETSETSGDEGQQESRVMKGAFLQPPFTCAALSDPATYAEGAMTAMRELIAGKPFWFFRTEVDLQESFPMDEAAQQAFAELVDRLAQRGVRLVVMPQPTRGLMHAEELVSPWRARYSLAAARRSFLDKAQLLRALGAAVADMEPVLRGEHEQEYFFRRDHHWTPYGAQVSARQVAEVMLAEPGINEIPEVSYQTHPDILLRKMGTLNAAVAMVCGNSYGFQWVRGSITVPEEGTDSADALFGDVAAPAIALVGTSNSDNRDDRYKNYNFHGFLQQYLSRDVVNFAMTGGGATGSLQDLLLSEAFQSGQFRYLIWELPVNYPLEEQEVWRQLLPAASGGCSNRALLASQATTVPVSAVDDRIEVLANAGERRRLTAGKPHLLLEMNYSDSNFKDFYVLAYYDDGQREKIRIRRPARLDTGRFLLRLDPPSRHGNLLSVLLEFEQPQPVAMTVETALCDY